MITILNYEGIEYDCTPERVVGHSEGYKVSKMGHTVAYVARQGKYWYGFYADDTSFEGSAMTAEDVFCDLMDTLDAEDIESVTPPAKDNSPWIVCPVCSGKGTTVNPNIDSNGLSASEMHDDPDFAEDYMKGTFDITCRGCNGRTTVKQSRIDELDRNAADRRLAALEDGDFESYCGAQDRRYG